MEDIIERLKELRRKLGLNQGKFAKELELSQGACSDIENGKKPLTERNIKYICLNFNVNENWFRNGVGQMFNQIPIMYMQVMSDEEGKQLTMDESKFIRLYRRLTPVNRVIAMRQVDVLLKSQFDAAESENDGEKETMAG